MKNLFTYTCLLVGIAVTNWFFTEQFNSNHSPETELAIVDQSLQNYQNLIKDLPKSMRVILVADSQGSLDGLQSELAKSKNLKRVHLLTHGTNGEVILGGVHLHESNMKEHHNLWQAFRSSTTKDAELLIYSCDLALGAEGQTFVMHLADELAMSVAASADPTGAAVKGGNWNLEFVAGAVDRNNVMNLPAFDGLLVPKFTALTGNSSPLQGFVASGGNELIYGDFDNDGDTDIHSYPGPGQENTFWRNNGDGTFTNATTLPTNPFRNLTKKAAFSNAANAFVADFDNDGDDDVLATRRDPDKNVFFRNDNGTFVERNGSDSPFNGITIAQNTQIIFGDFDNDGDIDLDTWNGDINSVNEFWRNNGSGVFTKVTNVGQNPFRNLGYVGGFYNSATYARVEDWDNDGDDDIFLVEYDNTNSNVLLRNDNGVFVKLTGASSPFNGIPIWQKTQFKYGDFDSDGDIDIYTAQDATVRYYYQNNGSGSFSRVSGADNPFDLLQYKGPFYDTATSAFVADWDNDGDDDVFTTNLDNVQFNVLFDQTGAAPKIASLVPATNAAGVSVSANLVLNFDKAVNRVSGKNITIKRANGNTVATIPVDNAQVTGTGTSTITINPTADLDGLTSFYVLIDAGAFQDAEGRPFKGYTNTTDYTFTTAATPVAPTLTTASAASITTTTALLGGEVTSDGNAAVSDRGIVWATTSNPTTGNNKIQNGSGAGSFSATVNNLPQGTRIYVRAYASNEKGTSYGNQIDFYTKTTVSSITLRDASPTNANSVSYDVVFAQSVVGVGTDDFGATVTGSTVASVSNVSGSGATYIVSLAISGGNGTARLDLTGTAGTTPNTNQAFVSASGYTIYRVTDGANYFRKLSDSGNWNTASVWESSADQSYWIPATSSPTSSAVSVQVASGATVTVPLGISASSGTVTTAGKLIINGTLTVSGTLTSTGTLAGSGTLGSSTVTNNGTIAPGNSPGILSFNGNVVSENTVNVELAGVTPGTGYDQILVSGSMVLSGTLNVTLASGYTPVLNDEFTIIDAGSISGTFTTVNLPSVSPRIWSTTYNETNGTLVLKVVNDPLPVTLARFSGKKLEQRILLSWQTTAETNSSHFEIERSAKNLVWEKMGEQAAIRESVSIQNYSYTDEQPMVGENLYRLKMVDADGSFSYSTLISVQFEGGQLSVYPNPVSEKLFIKNNKNIRSVAIYHTTGALILTSQSLPDAGLDVHQLAIGVYVVSTTDMKGDVAVFKFVKN
ncbi:MAG TPA: DUF4347 domain-containing protein [Dyadobacter sp.]|nr:DUF4347 domain-containing protein [Dyadobacter sp.]